MSHVMLISGSPSIPSRSAFLLDQVAAALQRQPLTTQRIEVRDLPAVALLHADARAPAIVAALEAITHADAVVIATPIYKTAYSGVLKLLLDLLPQQALADKIVLPIATGGSLAHLLSLDYALKPVLYALGARHLTDNVFAIESQLPKSVDGGYSIEMDLLARLEESVEHLSRTLAERAELLAHRAALARPHALPSVGGEPGDAVTVQHSAAASGGTRIQRAA